MVYPKTWTAGNTIPAVDMQDLQSAVQNAQSTADQARALANAGGGGSNALNTWGANLDSFATGAEIPGSTVTDDTLLTRALTYAAAQSQIPAIVIPPLRPCTFTQFGRVPFTGMKIVGVAPAGAFPQNPEIAAGKNLITKVRLNVGTGTSAWFVASGTTFAGLFANIGFDSSNDNTQMIEGVGGTSNMFGWVFHNLSFQAFKHVLGRPTSPWAQTLCFTTGVWNVTTAKGRQFDIGGSDGQFWMGGGRLNVGPGGQGTLNGAGEYLVRFNAAKCAIGPIYITADDHWRGMLLEGNMQFQHDNQIYGPTIEGRNKDDFSDGTLIRINGGGWQFYGGSVQYGMGATGVAPFTGDRGLVHITAGEVGIHGMTFDFAQGINQLTTPSVFASGGEVGIYQCKRGAKSTAGAAWGGRPRVQQSTAGIILGNDYTTTLVTAA